MHRRQVDRHRIPQAADASQLNVLREPPLVRPLLRALNVLSGTRSRALVFILGRHDEPRLGIRDLPRLGDRGGPRSEVRRGPRFEARGGPRFEVRGGLRGEPRGGPRLGGVRGFALRRLLAVASLLLLRVVIRTASRRHTGALVAAKLVAHRPRRSARLLLHRAPCARCAMSCGAPRQRRAVEICRRFLGTAERNASSISR
mmetsp:Transcript_10897/g.46470  ORF Transcript_10897/g.46470 Transcript_10897/m.46470 type:complete len:201 (-) Transcript_10897:351-953(-)